MIDLDALCAELNTALPAAGWPLRYPLVPFTRPDVRIASAIWGPGSNGRPARRRRHHRLAQRIPLGHSGAIGSP